MNYINFIKYCIVMIFVSISFGCFTDNQQFALVKDKSIKKITYEYFKDRSAKNSASGTIIEKVFINPTIPKELVNDIANLSMHSYIIPGSGYEKLIIEMTSDKKITLKSAHRLFEKNKNLIADDYGIGIKTSEPHSISKELKEFKKTFNRLILNLKDLKYVTEPVSEK